MRKSEAMRYRQIIETAVQSLPDSEALEAVTLYPDWAAGQDYPVGFKVQRGGALYKVLQAHTSQDGWEPENVPAMWTAIDKSHAGTAADPIPAARGMEYTYGLYYLDGEDGKTYLCTRTGEAEGGKIVLQYLPHELIGQYFAAA